MKALKHLGILISTRHCKATQKMVWIEFGLHFASKITLVGVEGVVTKRKVIHFEV